MNEIKPFHSEADYEVALAEVDRLWGARSGTPQGDRLDVLATLIDAYDAEHYAIGEGTLNARRDRGRPRILKARRPFPRRDRSDFPPSTETA